VPSFIRALFVAALLVYPGCAFAAEPTLLHPMFQDHAVLQRDRPISIYGQAPAGVHLTISFAAATVDATADKTGHWRALLPAMAAGGPYTLDVRSDSGAEQKASDILVGDVFLCSGQSNMQLPVRWAGNAAMEIRDATDSRIRAMTVEDHESTTPLERFANPVQWMVTSPATAGDFSASCYYFARELKKTIHVPIGMIMASWGGTRLSNWLSESGLRKLGYFNDSLDALDAYRSNPEAGQQRWSNIYQAWWRRNGKGMPWSPFYSDKDWAVAPPQLGPWAFWTGTSPDGFVGQMWMRTTVNLTAAQAAKPAILDLGSVNEDEQSWVNGRGVGGTSWAHPTSPHPIPVGVLHAGENSIVTNIFCSWRNCGLSGPAESRAIRFKDGTNVLLANPWRYKQVPDTLIAPQLPWSEVHGTAMDYNGMIAPIGHYGLRGVVWYQGASNMYFTAHYRRTLNALMDDWRKTFATDLPFLVVQLPNYGAFPTKPVASAWADIREAQRRAVAADPNAALAVAIDIGDPKVLHPPNKQELGRRLSIAARHLIYGEKIAPSGPMAQGAHVENGKVVIPFTDVTGSLVSYSGSPNAFELCGAAQASCRYVDARIQGNSVVLQGAPGKAERVRYCWGDSPICTLSDASGLPVGPFEVKIGSPQAAGR
jgi:sialate O-acetylesterase